MKCHQVKVLSMNKFLTTYGVLPPRHRTHLTVKLPACVPPPIELKQGLFTLLLSGQTTQRHKDKSRVSSKNSHCADYLFDTLVQGCEKAYVSNCT